MEFGKVAGLSNVDVTLPPDDPATATVLAAGKGGGRTRLFVGCPLWNDPALARKFMPKGAPASARLVHYATQFNAIELNASGYGLEAAEAGRWASLVTPGFLFCPKVPMDVSHARNLDVTESAFDRFLGAAGCFGDHLGPTFLQFPDSFGPSRLPELERLLRRHAAKLPLAVELRHPAWFNDPRRRDALFGLLRELGLAAVITDAPGRRDVVHQRLTAPWAFIRFSGHDLSPKDVKRLDDWAGRIQGWLDAGLESLYFFLHHEPKHFSIDWSARFIETLHRVCGAGPALPRLQSAQPRASSKGNKKAPGSGAQGDLFG